MNLTKPKILHIAPFNVAGVPITFVKAERKLGFYSRLITLGKHHHNYDEDICLNLPFINLSNILFVKKIFSNKSKLEVTFDAPVPADIPIKWQPNNNIEKNLILLREILWVRKIRKAIEEININQFDIIQLDCGLGFFRNGRIIRKLHNNGKRIICCYTGSDLRTRGVIPEIDEISSINFTVEFDHLQRHPNINHIFFPFDCDQFKNYVHNETNKKLLIGHAPTNRKAKGSDIIIPVVRQLEKEYPVQLVLIENLTYKEALQKKSQCDIFIDQIGNLGYGINSLESLAMKIPTCSCLAPGFEKMYPEHPFVVIDQENIKQKLIELIEDIKLRRDKAEFGINWVEKNHNYINVVKSIHNKIGFVTL